MISSNKDEIGICSFNCRGLRDKKKRLAIFKWLSSSHNGLIMLQEMHTITHDEKNWQDEWKGDIYFSHGTNQSKGVAILIPSDIKTRVTVLNMTKDKEGRMIILDCNIDDNPFLLKNLYAPTKDHCDAQLNFLQHFTDTLEQLDNKNLIIGGDLNTYLNPELDKKGGNIENASKYASGLKRVIEEYNLSDIWRLRNPSDLKFTRRENSRGGLVQARLDYFLISNNVTSQVSNCSIKPGLKSDHSIIKLTIQLINTQHRGRGYWKFNNKLLHDEVYVSLVKEEIQKIALDTYLKNKNVLWDFAKCQLRTITITYSKTKARKNNEKEKFLQQQLEALEKDVTENSDKILEYKVAKTEWEQYQNEKAEGAILRSKVQFTEMGEKNTKYFLNLEKRNYNSKYIKKLICSNNSELTNPEDILEEEKRYYYNLYSSKVAEEEQNIEVFLKDENIPLLSDIEKEMCETPLKLHEIAKALKNLKNDKSPGNDGFTANFYKFFWPDIKMLLFDSYKYSFQNGLLTSDQRRGILNLIPKPNKDLRYLKNWRPVSILNTDYKILTKALANRLQFVLPKLINSDQVGYLKNRYIGENVRIIDDIMSYTNLKQTQGYIILLDFEKAFDSAEWSFLFKTLKAFNFGPNFIKWIEIVYNSIESCVSNNGYFSQYFKLNRGIRQGCPISALLFLLVVEVMAVVIRNKKLINGINIENKEYKICQLADDTTIFVRDIESVVHLITFLKNFYNCSGLKINLEKSEIIPVGSSRFQNIYLPKIISK